MNSIFPFTVEDNPGQTADEQLPVFKELDRKSVV